MSPGEDGTGLSALPQPALPRVGRRAASREGGEAFPPLYRAVRAACAPVLRSLFRLDVSGLDHLPASGPFIVASNHHNYLDGVVLAVAVPRPIAFLVMPRVYQASPLHPPFHRAIGSIAIDVEGPDPGAIKRALRALRDGRIIGIFPEGPFSHEGRLVPGQPGVAVIALRAGVPVVPAAIHGTYEALTRRRFHLPRPFPLSVRFGRPLSFAPGRVRAVPRGVRDEATRQVMSEIAAMLDEMPAPAAS